MFRGGHDIHRPPQVETQSYIYPGVAWRSFKEGTDRKDEGQQLADGET